MKDCLRYVPLIGAREGELSSPEAESLAGHLATCASCRALQAELAAVDGLVAEGLLGAANARDFAPFVDEVMARIGAPAGRAASPQGVLAWLRHHWRGAAATFAPVVAALALFLYVRWDGGVGQVAALELSSEGNVSTVLQTKDGPVVLIDDDDPPEGS